MEPTKKVMDVAKPAKKAQTAKSTDNIQTESRSFLDAKSPATSNAPGESPILVKREGFRVNPTGALQTDDAKPSTKKNIAFKVVEDHQESDLPDAPLISDLPAAKAAEALADADKTSSAGPPELPSAQPAETPEADSKDSAATNESAANINMSADETDQSKPEDATEEKASIPKTEPDATDQNVNPQDDDSPSNEKPEPAPTPGEPDDTKLNELKAKDKAKTDAMQTPKVYDTKEYYLPIGQRRGGKKSSSAALFVLLLLILLALGFVLAVDAGILDIGVKLPFDLIK